MKKLQFLFVGLVMMFFTSVLFAQNITVTGTMYDTSTGEPLPYASVMVKGQNLGVSTDDLGRFEIQVPGNGVLRLSYIGYETLEVPVNNRANLGRIGLNPETSFLDEVMVVAYGTVKRGGFTGAATQIDSKDIEVRPVSVITNALEGMAGVQMTPSSGQPGSNPTIRIRGFGSLNASNDPLIVVDGFPYGGALADINQDDVESMTVLKDASSAALYGARAANGVIMITTKRGRPGTLNVNFKTTQGVSTRAYAEYDRLGPSQYVEMMWETMRNSLMVSQNLSVADASIKASQNIVGSGIGYNAFGVPDDQLVSTDGKINPQAKLFSDDFDWTGAVTRLGYRGEYGVTANGGSDKYNYLLSVSYLNDNGYIIRSNMERYKARASVNVSPKKWITFGGSVDMTHAIMDNTETGTNYLSPFNWIREMAPIYPIYKHNPDGSYVLDDTGEKIFDYEGSRPYSMGRHVIAETLWNDSVRKRDAVSTRANVRLTLLEGLTFTVNAGFDKQNRFDRRTESPKLGDGAPAGRGRREYNAYSTWNFNQILNYRKQFGSHNVDLTLGHESYDYEYNYFYSMRTGVIKEGNTELVNYTTIASATSYSVERASEGYIGRVVYDYDDKYFLEASLRRDASSRFYKDNRWGNFWSVGGSWRLDREDFLKVSWINSLKFRAAYGQTGNDGLNSSYAWQSLYDIQRNANEPGFIQDRAAGNRDIEWEKSSSLDFALEYGLFNHRLTGSLEFYHRISDNLLFQVAQPESSGVASQYQNIGTMYNQGIEFQINAGIIRKKDFSWNVNLNMNTLKNEITKMPEANKDGIISGYAKWMEGHSRYDYWLRTYMGVNPENGYTMYKLDWDETGAEPEASATQYLYNGTWVTQDHNKAKYEYHGSSIPKLFGSISTSLKYKNLSLSLMFTYRFGGKIYNNVYAGLMSQGSYGSAKHVDILNRWQKPGDVTDVPVMIESLSTQLNAGSSRFLVDGTSFQFRTATISYTLPKKWVSAMDLKNINLYVSGENLYIFSKIKGMNPSETFAGSQNSSTYNPARVITFGLNVSF